MHWSVCTHTRRSYGDYKSSRLRSNKTYFSFEGKKCWKLASERGRERRREWVGNKERKKKKKQRESRDNCMCPMNVQCNRPPGASASQEIKFHVIPPHFPLSHYTNALDNLRIPHFYNSAQNHTTRKETWHDGNNTGEMQQNEAAKTKAATWETKRHSKQSERT